jgi:hypothetical protein
VVNFAPPLVVFAAKTPEQYSDTQKPTKKTVTKTQDFHANQKYCKTKDFIKDKKQTLKNQPFHSRT